MFNPQAPPAEASTRSLVFRQALAAAFKSRRQNLPPAPASLSGLLAGCQNGVQGLLSRPGCRDALGEIRARVFHTPGRDAEVQACWHDGVASAVFAARVAQLTQASVPASFLGALLHRSGEALALKILARVELDYRLKLDSSSRREWCGTHSVELVERLLRAWNLPEHIAVCVLGWMRVGEYEAVSGESRAVYFGRLLAIESSQPDFCVPGSLEHAAADLGISADLIVRARQEEARSLIRALD